MANEIIESKNKNGNNNVTPVISINPADIPSIYEEIVHLVRSGNKGVTPVTIVGGGGGEGGDTIQTVVFNPTNNVLTITTDVNSFPVDLSALDNNGVTNFTYDDITYQLTLTTEDNTYTIDLSGLAGGGGGTPESHPTIAVETSWTQALDDELATATIGDLRIDKMVEIMFREFGNKILNGRVPNSAPYVTLNGVFEDLLNVAPSTPSAYNMTFYMNKTSIAQGGFLKLQALSSLASNRQWSVQGSVAAGGIGSYLNAMTSFYTLDEAWDLSVDNTHTPLDYNQFIDLFYSGENIGSIVTGLTKGSVHANLKLTIDGLMGASLGNYNIAFTVGITPEKGGFLEIYPVNQPKTFKQFTIGATGGDFGDYINLVTPTETDPIYTADKPTIALNSTEDGVTNEITLNNGDGTTLTTYNKTFIAGLDTRLLAEEGKKSNVVDNLDGTYTFVDKEGVNGATWDTSTTPQRILTLAEAGYDDALQTGKFLDLIIFEFIDNTLSGSYPIKVGDYAGFYVNLNQAINDAGIITFTNPVIEISITQTGNAGFSSEIKLRSTFEEFKTVTLIGDGVSGVPPLANGEFLKAIESSTQQRKLDLIEIGYDDVSQAGKNVGQIGYYIQSLLTYFPVTVSDLINSSAYPNLHQAIIDSPLLGITGTAISVDFTGGTGAFVSADWNFISTVNNGIKINLISDNYGTWPPVNEEDYFRKAVDTTANGYLKIWKATDEIVPTATINNAGVPNTANLIVFDGSEEAEGNGFFEVVPITDPDTSARGNFRILKAGNYRVDIKANVEKTGTQNIGTYQIAAGLNTSLPSVGDWARYPINSQGAVDDGTVQFSGISYVPAGSVIKLYHSDIGSGGIRLSAVSGEMHPLQATISTI